MELITHEPMNSCLDGGGVVWNHLGSRERADAKVLVIYLFGVIFFFEALLRTVVDGVGNWKRKTK